MITANLMPGISSNMCTKTYLTRLLCNRYPITCLKLCEWNEPRGGLLVYDLHTCHIAGKPTVVSL